VVRCVTARSQLGLSDKVEEILFWKAESSGAPAPPWPEPPSVSAWLPRTALNDFLPFGASASSDARPVNFYHVLYAFLLHRNNYRDGGDAIFAPGGPHLTRVACSCPAHAPLRTASRERGVTELARSASGTGEQHLSEQARPAAARRSRPSGTQANALLAVINALSLAGRDAWLMFQDPILIKQQQQQQEAAPRAKRALGAAEAQRPEAQDVALRVVRLEDVRRRYCLCTAHLRLMKASAHYQCVHAGQLVAAAAQRRACAEDPSRTLPAARCCCFCRPGSLTQPSLSVCMPVLANRRVPSTAGGDGGPRCPAKTCDLDLDGLFLVGSPTLAGRATRRAELRPCPADAGRQVPPAPV
jgi:hypothetical protein